MGKVSLQFIDPMIQEANAAHHPLSPGQSTQISHCTYQIVASPNNCCLAYVCMLSEWLRGLAREFFLIMLAGYLHTCSLAACHEHAQTHEQDSFSEIDNEER